MAYLPEDNHLVLSKFESMLKTNDILFFDSEEFESIINHYLELGKITLAKRAIKLGLDQHPSSINLKLLKVETLVIENKFNEADLILEELYLLEPNNEEVFIQKANVLSRQEKHKEAIEALIIALNMSNNAEEDADLYGLIGMEYLFMDDFDNALTYFKICLEYDPEDYSALHNIVYCYDFLNKKEEAIYFLNTYLDQNPYCEVAWHQLGKQYFTIKDYEKAKAAFDFAIISDDTFVGAYIEKGKVLEKLKDYHKAIENYKITLALDDPMTFALLRIGHCYEKVGDFEKALEYFTKTLEDDPLLDKGWIAITKLYMKRLDYQKALYYIEKAIDIDSENVLFWKVYATINKRLNFIEEAEYGYKKSLELGNYELDTWIERADMLIALGEYEVAINNLVEANEFYPNNAEIEYRLAGLYFSLSYTNEASFHLKNALKLDKDYAFIINELFPNLKDIDSIINLINNQSNS